MKIVLGLFFFYNALFGGVFDYYYQYKANSFEKEKRYNEAIYNYKQIKDKSDEVNYNLGNLYYKEKNYQKALDSYQKIKTTNKELEYKRLHNSGNSYAKLDQIDKAIKAYEKALQIKNDKDTLYNLDLLKKKKQQENKDQKDQEQKKNDQQNDNNSSMKNDQKQKNEQVNDDKKMQKDEKTKQDKKQAQQRKAAELSDLEEKKWSGMLENRDIKTLVVPLTKNGEKNAQNIKPW